MVRWRAKCTIGCQAAWKCKPSGLGLWAKWLGSTHWCWNFYCTIDVLLMPSWCQVDAKWHFWCITDAKWHCWCINDAEWLGFTGWCQVAFLVLSWCQVAWFYKLMPSGLSLHMGVIVEAYVSRLLGVQHCVFTIATFLKNNIHSQDARCTWLVREYFVLNFCLIEQHVENKVWLEKYIEERQVLIKTIWEQIKLDIGQEH